ncbi:Putative START-like domain superfamily protein [Septoria linicola]|uniref:START-like domain superfamily protein n=1 Tax=Septoria linicola TaxID=215465 RepID=A0A9Q9EHS2_9PEZI|nr:putative START-like domain superfamily protein [Septoria linicola]USW49593.1 Putative START-like domain superfamily protein [Septoria linicola]
MSSSTWPPASGLTTIVVPRKDAVLHIASSTTIAAPASFVLETVLHIENYKSWNQFVPSARILKQDLVEGRDASDFSHMHKGSIMNFDVVMDSKKPDKTTETNLLVTDISTPDTPSDYLSHELLQDPSFTADLSKVYRVSWTTHGGFVARGLRSERFHEIIVKSDHECEVRTWEVMGGLLAYTVKWMFQSTLQTKFELWNSDLKQWCEKKYAARQEAT